MHKVLSTSEKETFIATLKTRFEKNMHRHEAVLWEYVMEKLENEEKLWSLHEMELSGGEPDVVTLHQNSAELIFCDCAKESPKGRRSVCYDQQAQKERKKHPPKSNAIDMAAEMGVELMTEAVYRKLQEVEPMDLKTSSWIHTPDDIRKLGGALFCDCRYDHVFTYHNGAQSYYSSRGFRTLLEM